ncbi:VOC family protein [Microvirga rosea]|uniref:VOC family protein n=1 Tax=Microvirga rosea TaxID=2715425 RepID=UPI001D0BC889|nr:VOC family protein [Microvirga rosea]MCB8821943.1 VOC family protein [Microvirga rosea]
MSQLAPILDHVVINVLDQLDGAAALYRRLGFHLTERGHHTLGSSNHLAVFGENYLELLGFEPGRPTQRADLWKHPPGLTGLVFKTADSLRLHSTLVDKAVPVENPAEFSRLVDLPQGTRDAAFRVVRLSSELVPNGRVFFCHHLTPDLVWRNEWRDHPNGAVDIVEFVIAANDPSRTADLYRRIFGSETVTEIPDGFALSAGRATVLFLTPDGVEGRYKGAASVDTSRGDRMVALTLRTRSLDLVNESVKSGRIPDIRTEAGRVVVPYQQAGGVALAFVE